jgi:hypothetical protein
MYDYAPTFEMGFTDMFIGIRQSLQLGSRRCRRDDLRRRGRRRGGRGYKGRPLTFAQKALLLNCSTDDSQEVRDVVC